MGNSTITVQDTVDLIATMGDVNPQANPGAFATNLILTIANDTMSDLCSERFNFKWNSKNAPSFLTNSWQRDYPQIGLKDVAWIEAGIWVEINSTSLPLPSDEIIAVKDMLLTNPGFGGGSFTGWPTKICWLYNRQLSYGVWPGAAQVFTPLLGANPQVANPPMCYRDTNGNILTLTAFGTTGSTAAAAPANSIEGVTVNDGSCVWTVCDPDGQGWRIFPFPPSAGPVYQVNPIYQQASVKFVAMDQTLDPLPDDFAANYRTGFKTHSIKYSADKNIRATFIVERKEWLDSIEGAQAQGDREPDDYMMIPATQVVEPFWGRRRNPNDPGTPY